MLISFEKVVQQIGKKPAGILHLGAHEGEESAEYQKLGVEKVIWIEGNPVVYEKLAKNLVNIPGQQAFNILVSDTNEMVDFSIMNFDQSSSIMPIGVHKLHHPGINVVRTIQLPAYRIEDYFSQQHISLQGYDFLNIDLQGAELKALKGLGPLLDQFNYIITEVNTTRIYKGCPVLPELDAFLYEKGFIRTKLELTKYQWGDALYERKPCSKSKFRLLHLQARLIQLFSYRHYLRKKLAGIVKKMIGRPA
jgi:FkbM family methyltransferase